MPCHRSGHFHWDDLPLVDNTQRGKTVPVTSYLIGNFLERHPAKNYLESMECILWRIGQCPKQRSDGMEVAVLHSSRQRGNGIISAHSKNLNALSALSVFAKFPLTTLIREGQMALLQTMPRIRGLLLDWQ